MKQHITVEQLNELSDKPSEKLNKWLVKSKHITEDEKKLAKEIGIKTGIVLLSIGQMIEFLGKELLNINYDYEYKEYEVVAKSSYNAEEAVDALWEAVKEVLNGH